MRIAILGLGIVGRGVYDILIKETKIEIPYIIELDDQKLQGLEHLKAPSYEHVLHDRSIDAIVEVIGGKTTAYKMVKQALQAKKHVVTANKALISAYFEELHMLAEKNHVSIQYEASVLGATLVIKPLMRVRHINHFYHIEGILNGTTNFVLTQVFKHHKSMKDALLEANARGFIEVGSNDDMLGLDAMRKINIMSMLLYHTIIDEEDIIVTPLTHIKESMIEYLKTNNYIIKYIAYSILSDQNITIEVIPMAIKKPSVYDHIDDEMNILTAYGTYHQKQAFIGQGAGRYPTATAIISDLENITNASLDITSHKKYAVNQKRLNHAYLIETNEGFKVIHSHETELLKQKDIKSYIRIEEQS